MELGDHWEKVGRRLGSLPWGRANPASLVELTWVARLMRRAPLLSDEAGEGGPKRQGRSWRLSCRRRMGRGQPQGRPLIICPYACRLHWAIKLDTVWRPFRIRGSNQWAATAFPTIPPARMWGSKWSKARRDDWARAPLPGHSIDHGRDWLCVSSRAILHSLNAGGAVHSDHSGWCLAP